MARSAPAPVNLHHAAGAGRAFSLAVTLALVTLGWLIVAWPWLSGEVTIPYDAKAHFHAQLSFLAQSLDRGESPFWLPYAFAGHPQIADPQSLIFSPFLLLAMATPNPSFQQADTLTLAMLLFGAYGIVGYGRERDWHPAAIVLAALVFAFGAGAGWRIQHIGQILSLSYFPWALWMLDRALLRNSWGYGALSGLFAALMLLNRDQVSYLAALLLTLRVILHWCEGRGYAARVFASLKPLLAGGLVGTLVLLVPLLLTLALAAGSNRAAIDLAGAEMGSLHPTHLLTLLIPNLFGVIGPDAAYWGAPSVHWPVIVNLFLARNMAMLYLGALPLIALIAALGRCESWRGPALFTVLGFIFALLYGLGRYTPLFALAYKTLPGVDLFRRPADATFLIGAMGALLAGFGLDGMLRAKHVPWRVIGIAAALLGLAALALALWLGKFTQALPPIGLTLGFWALCILLLHRGVSSSPSLPPLVLAGLIGALMVLDFRVNLRPNASTGLPPAEYAAMRLETQDPLIAALKSRLVTNETRRDRVELAGLGFHWPNLGLVHRMESTLGYNPLRLRAYAEASGAGDIPARADQRAFSPLLPSYRAPLADLLGLRFIALGQKIETVDASMMENPLQLIAEGPGYFLYENPNTYPRVMWVPEARALDQDALIRTGRWPRTDFANVVFVDPDAPLPLRALTPGTARITRYQNTRIAIALSAPAGGVLLLNDIWHPDWVAQIDGQPTRIWRANGIFRAVILPEGAKEVRFEFRPFSGLLAQLMRRKSP